MNVEDYIKHRGLIDVPNPEYNPKAKKNKKPKYIQKTDVSGQENNIFSTPLISMENMVLLIIEYHLI